MELQNTNKLTQATLWKRASTGMPNGAFLSKVIQLFCMIPKNTLDSPESMRGYFGCRGILQQYLITNFSL